MRAAYIEEFGGPEKVKVGDRPAPEAGPGQVVIRNRAAGVGPWDWKMVAGMFGKMPLPTVAGFEAAGVIESVGEGVDLRPGDEVFATVQGGFAEYSTGSADRVALKPTRLSHEEAAGLVISAGTAYEGLVDRARIQPGQTVLITTAAGGVDSAAVQIAAALGARVIAVAGPYNH